MYMFLPSAQPFVLFAEFEKVPDAESHRRRIRPAYARFAYLSPSS